MDGFRPVRSEETVKDGSGHLAVVAQPVRVGATHRFHDVAEVAGHRGDRCALGEQTRRAPVDG